MDPKYIQEGKRYRYAQHKLGINEIVVCRRVHADERLNISGPYLHVTVDVERTSGEIMTVGPRRIGRAAGESYSEGLDETGGLIGQWRETQKLVRAHEREHLWKRPASEFSHLSPDHPSDTVIFNHPTELDMALKLDQLGIEWQHERCGFTLQDCRFLPDFHIPALDLFVEITTSTFSSKSAKLNHMARQAGHVNVIALCVDKLQHVLTINDPEAMMGALRCELWNEKHRAWHVRDSDRRAASHLVSIT